MNTPAIEDELRALKTDAILAPNKPLTRLAIYKWLDQHDIHIHSDYVVKLDNLIQAIHAENLAAHTAQAVKLAEIDGQVELLVGAIVFNDGAVKDWAKKQYARLQSQRQALISNEGEKR